MFDRDTKFAQFRIAFVQYLTVVIFFLLSTGFWRLQISQPDYYKELADQNRIKSLPLLAPRGRIVDREGRVIVSNYPSFSILLLREQMRDHDHDLPRIAGGLELDLTDLRARVGHFRSAPLYTPIIVKEDATFRDLAFVEAHRDEFPELEYVTVARRLYPRDGFLAHLIGYLGEVSDSELDMPEFAAYHPGGIVGKSGVERQYNDILMGEDGLRRVMVNNRGHEVGKVDEKPATAGKQLRLTIDLDLQAAAEEAMEGKNGAVVALDPRNGEVLALVSHPVFDPNDFAVRIKPEEWRGLMSDPDRPLLDRAVQAQLAPGSVFKVFMSVGGLEEGTLTPETAVTCHGGAVFYGRYFKCWEKKGHGYTSLHRAIVQSCDVFFYTAGQRLGIDKIAYYATHLGLGQRTGIDLPGEESGVIPSPQWKLRMFREKWYAGETISVAIGQGSMQVTPLQLAYALGGIASGGVFRRPHVVFPAEVRPYRPEADLDRTIHFPLKDETVEQVTSGLYGVVNEGGTGARARLQGVDLGGKTGTAQLSSNELAKARRGKKPGDLDLRDNAWFVAVSPHKNPEIAVAVLFEHGLHSYFAAPIAREVVRVYWEKKKRETGKEFAQVRKPGPRPAAGANVAASGAL